MKILPIFLPILGGGSSGGGGDGAVGSGCGESGSYATGCSGGGCRAWTKAVSSFPASDIKGSRGWSNAKQRLCVNWLDGM